ncbi:MAG: OmpA family protein [Hydrogenovibrio crunogenus]|uniref:OmpA family protein n=1 Tax=Hydrogenovibrio crunogenus (strain DSM 25203 / XCL-2) TaxID=317025 RepID=Q31J67_HYDCU|nr:OmpA family protein [Hydrogenovibrio crunogenus]
MRFSLFLCTLTVSLSSFHASSLFAQPPTPPSSFTAEKTLLEKAPTPEKLSSLYRDLDQDGVVDKQDHCLNSLPNQPVNAFGCEADEDHDGVVDRLDQCHKTPIGISVNEVGCEGDADLDGIIDSLDQCPGTLPGVVVNKAGCRLDTDLDRDGVLNNKDQCPNTPIGVTVNQYGCEPKSLVVTNIVFDLGSYKIRPDQKPILDKDISQLRSLKDHERIVITGFTDSLGSESSNLKLSWNRAQATKDYLVRKFKYDPASILVLGKGEANPVATNKTKEGRKQNRRISFMIMDQQIVPNEALAALPDDMKHYNRYQE